MYNPFVPGDAAAPKSVFAVQLFAVKYPLAQSPMMVNTEVPAISRLAASSQPRLV